MARSRCAAADSGDRTATFRSRALPSSLLPRRALTLPAAESTRRSSGASWSALSSGEQTVAMANDFELLVLFTSTPGFHVDVKMAEMMKDTNPKLKVAFVGPPVTVEPEKSLRTSPAIDFVV